MTLIPQCTSDKVSAGCAVPPRSAVSQEEAEGRRVPVQGHTACWHPARLPHPPVLNWGRKQRFLWQISVGGGELKFSCQLKKHARFHVLPAVCISECELWRKMC